MHSAESTINAIQRLLTIYYALTYQLHGTHTMDNRATPVRQIKGKKSSSLSGHRPVDPDMTKVPDFQSEI